METDGDVARPVAPTAEVAGDEKEFLIFSPRGSRSRCFEIRTALGVAQRRSVNRLIGQRYGWRGYGSVSVPEVPATHSVTFSAIESDAIVGTLTVRFDGAEPIQAEETFPEEIAALRAQSRKLCEFTKLAIDPVKGSKHVLASLFHIAYALAHRLRGCDTLVMEVNPRHVAYYCRMLGGRVLGAERMHPRVHAPAVLLILEFSHIRGEIARCGGRLELAPAERSLYPYGLDAAEEEVVLDGMRLAQLEAAAGANRSPPRGEIVQRHRTLRPTAPMRCIVSPMSMAPCPTCGACCGQTAR